MIDLTSDAMMLIGSLPNSSYTVLIAIALNIAKLLKVVMLLPLKMSSIIISSGLCWRMTALNSVSKVYNLSPYDLLGLGLIQPHLLLDKRPLLRMEYPVLIDDTSSPSIFIL